jgi:hypothetical protein
MAAWQGERECAAGELRRAAPAQATCSRRLRARRASGEAGARKMGGKAQEDSNDDVSGGRRGAHAVRAARKCL